VKQNEPSTIVSVLQVESTHQNIMSTQEENNQEIEKVFKYSQLGGKECTKSFHY
jgi:hypothetical protein